MGETFYREQEGPKDSEVKQPGEGVEYNADSPSTYQSKQPRKDKGMPPGNPGFVNLPERDSMNPSSGKVIPEQMQETLRNQLTYVNTASAKRVAAMYCNPLATSTAWIDPRGKVYEIPRSQTHDQWAERHLAGNDDFEESGQTGWTWLVDRGWVRFVNFLNLEVRAQGASRAAMAAAADLVIDCVLSRRDVEPEDLITFGVGIRTQRPTVADFVAEWGSRGAEERLYEGLMDRLPGNRTEALADDIMARWARSKTAATIEDIMNNTGAVVHKRSQGLQVNAKRFNPDTGFWGFTVIGSKGEPYYVRIKGIRKSKAQKLLSSAQVKCSCSCPFWRWQGPEHWGKVNGYLYGRPRGTASFPVIRDPKEKHWACKHILAAMEKARTYRFSSEETAWSLEGEIVPMLEPSAARVAARAAATLWYHGRKEEGPLQTYVGRTFGEGASEVPLFFSPSKSFAKMYGRGPKGVIYTARLKWRKVFDGADLYRDSRYWPPEYEDLTPEGQKLYDDLAEGKVFAGIDEDDLLDGYPSLWAQVLRMDYDVIETTEFKRWLRKNGYDAAYVTGDGEKNVFVFSPDQVEVVSIDPTR